MDESLIKPKRLCPGGTIGVIAPAGRVDLEGLKRGVSSLEESGYKLILGQHLKKSYRYFAGSDEERANDFIEMMQNKEVDAVFCARGGSGSARILHSLQTLHPFPPKIFVGSSDITTLLLYLSRLSGFVTFHGPMIGTPTAVGAPTAVGTPTAVDTAPMERAKEPAQLSPLKNLLAVLAGEKVKMHADGMMSLKPGNAEGILTGGCLTLLCTTIGTAYEIETNGRILFIEDVNEAAYRIDRMLYYLKTLNKFNAIRGLIFGQMPHCEPNLLPEIILEMFAEYDFPILFGLPSGHGEALFTLPFGSLVQIDTKSCSLTLKESAVS